MKNKDYQLLLDENYVDEVYELLLVEFINLFKHIANEKLEEYNKDNVENIFWYFFWQAFKYSEDFNIELRKLKDLFLEMGFQDSYEKNILNEIESIFYEIKNKSNIKKELNISEYLKGLCNNNDYEFAIEMIQNLYYYPKFIKILNEKNISYKKYDSFNNILNLLKNNCREYRSILQTINGYYPYEITLKDRLNDLLDLTEAFD